MDGDLITHLIPQKSGDAHVDKGRDIAVVEHCRDVLCNRSLAVGALPHIRCVLLGALAAGAFGESEVAVSHTRQTGSVARHRQN